jgi:hypothetical protein
MMIHQDAVKCDLKASKAKIAQQIYIVGNCKFLVNSQILNWTNTAYFREKLPVATSGSKKLAAWESSFSK